MRAPSEARSEGCGVAHEELTRLTGKLNQGDVSPAFTSPEREALVGIPDAVLREAVRALGW
ncbi:hypothetical protein AB0945_06880 [Streptomyces sp. NPDC005474]|uniref:hypothetical protein n=1 Tax=Streptomyces sp. NPDC005474 TaxID=3154878 RepID=UPI0034524DF1